MPEETQTAEAQQASTAETTAGESQSQEKTTGTEAAGKQDTSAASTGEQKQSTTQDSKPETKPVSRRSAQYRIQQLANENKALKEGKQPAEQGSEEQPAATDDQPNVNKLVQDEVERRLSPIVSEHSKAADDAELTALFTGDKAPERTKYEGKIRDMWTLPQYKDVAASDLYKIASFDDAVKAATTKAIEDYKAAEKEARGSSASGTSNNSNRTGNAKTNLTDEQLLANNEKVKAGQK
jgi:hypothetical protein